MKKMFNFFGVILLSLLFVACSTKQETDLKTVQKVDLQKIIIKILF